jgi:hypothetical protein
MSQLALSLACGDYDRTRPLLDAHVNAEGIDFTPVVLPPPEMFWRQAPGLDPVAQRTFGAQTGAAPLAAPLAAMPATSTSFEVMNEGDDGHGVLPPDPNGDVGLNDYVQIVNTWEGEARYAPQRPWADRAAEVRQSEGA